MEQLGECVDDSRRDLVCKLQKAMYGLKQASRKRHEKVDRFLTVVLGFTTARSDNCLYIKRDTKSRMSNALYVDNMLLAGSEMNVIGWMKNEVNKRFEMKDLGAARLCIGIEISGDRQCRTLCLIQRRYAKSNLELFNMSDRKLSHTTMEVPKAMSVGVHDPSATCPYRKAIGCLMFLMVYTRADLAFALGNLAQHFGSSRENHRQSTKRVIRYPCSAIHYSAHYSTQY